MANFKLKYKKVDYPIEFFHLLAEFAAKVSEIKQIELSDALLNYTCVYRRLYYIQPPKDKKYDERWLSLGAKIDQLDRMNLMDIANIIFEEHILEANHSPHDDKNSKPNEFGPFAFEPIFDDKFFYIHFHNDNKRESPLAKEYEGKMIKYLTNMFGHIKANTEYSSLNTVKCESWLVNLNSFMRLFPDKFKKSTKVSKSISLKGLGLWGQFMRYNGVINERMYKEFLNKIDKAKDFDKLMDCFKFKLLTAHSPIEDFYEFYKV